MSVQPPRARLLCRTGEFAGATLEVGTQATVGRGTGNDLVLESPVLSSRHARIYLKDGEYWLEDLGSLNGTRLDGVEVTGATRLEKLHVITLADGLELIFVRPEGPVAEARPGAAPKPQTSAAEPQPGSAKPQAPAGPPPGKPPSPQAPEPRTVLDQPGFGELPDLAAKQAAPPPAAPHPSHTRVMEDFGTLPDLGKREEAAPAEPAPEAARLELVFALPGRGLQKVPLTKGEITLGRSDDCDIIVQDGEKRISRKHAVLRVAEDGITLTDLNSANGTFVQGDRIESVTLAPGASFQLGPELEFTILKR